jgi:hypothetical protein
MDANGCRGSAVETESSTVPVDTLADSVLVVVGIKALGSLSEERSASTPTTTPAAMTTPRATKTSTPSNAFRRASLCTFIGTPSALDCPMQST